MHDLKDNMKKSPSALVTSNSPDDINRFHGLCKETKRSIQRKSKTLDLAEPLTHYPHLRLKGLNIPLSADTQANLKETMQQRLTYQMLCVAPRCLTSSVQDALEPTKEITTQ